MAIIRWCSSVFSIPHFLYFMPEPQGHGSLRPIFSLALSWRGLLGRSLGSSPPPL